jgi:hypothetical protein
MCSMKGLLALQTSGSPSTGVNEWLSAGARVLDKALTSRGGCLAVDKGLAMANMREVRGANRQCRDDIPPNKQVTGNNAGGNCQARPYRLAAGQAGLGGRGALAWFEAAGEPRSGLIAGEAPGPAVLGGPPQAQAPPAYSLMPCACGGLKCRSSALLGAQLVPTL